MEQQSSPQPLEPHLLVPPELTQRALAGLKAAHAIPTHWQHGGRYGSRIAAERLQERTETAGARRTIPVLTAAADRISAYLEVAQAVAGGAEKSALPTAAASLPDELVAVLRSNSNVALRYLPCTMPRVPRAELFDARVHPDRAPSSPGTAVPADTTTISRRGRRQSEQPAAFTFVELFAGLGVRVQQFNSCKCFSSGHFL
jgi:hypothetical protein